MRTIISRWDAKIHDGLELIEKTHAGTGTQSGTIRSVVSAE